MDGSDLDDHRTFRVNFSTDGAAKLRDRVKYKLKEFMGDYTDDTLVEYVIVLLRNGRQKEEAKKELNVFLGDDSDSFINWLWNHLSSNLDLYVHPRESSSDEMAKTKMMSERNDSLPKQLSGSLHSDSDYDREKPVNQSRSRRHREWKGLVREAADPPPLCSNAIDNFHSEKPHHKSDRVDRTRSPRSLVHRKRKLQDERQSKQREVASHPTIDAPRRLLQFAVRDAVGTSQSSSSRPEPVFKRLRSVVSTSTGDASLDDRSKKMRSVASVPHAVATAIKAAAEAAEDVMKVRCSGNVFDRLGRGKVTSEATNLSSMLRAPTLENAEQNNSDQMIGEAGSRYFQSDYSGKIEGDLTMLDDDTGLASDSASDNDGYDEANITRDRVVNAFPIASSGKKDDDSLMVQYSVANDADEVIRKTLMKDRDTPRSAVPNASSKIVNISVNVNTWKPPHYKAAMEDIEIDNQVAMQEGEAAAGKLGVPTMKDNNTVMAANDNEMVHVGTQKEVQKTMPPTPGSYSTVRPSEDVDSRTIFVNNVHFAATKDTLSRHFNKFGEVLKVIIVADAATGQPKGSAYVEFMRKEAAEHALSLNGTSFMSRILKVVRRGSAHHEAAPMLVWPRMPRPSPFTARYARVPFPRAAIPNAFRTRLPIKSGARSLQWKRDDQVTPLSMASVAAGNIQNGAVNFGNNLSSPSKRNLTYLRTSN
ncbi:hypothetical protein MRB53_017583 [Persea americana]|uniref:Uncharacterized protein n=1 Tax=Persea americana TaxID=3435 RepID=A0ACC2M6E9_PERAE|nr:hypothetical protein MRB53_017583 [Persea americana]